MDAKYLVNEAREYLLGFPGVTARILDAQL
jgi:hypothetical protein